MILGNHLWSYDTASHYMPFEVDKVQERLSYVNRFHDFLWGRDTSGFLWRYPLMLVYSTWTKELVEY